MADFCQTCGAPVAPNDAYCVRCGAALAGNDAYSNPYATPSYSGRYDYANYDENAPDIPTNPVAAFKICVFEKYANFHGRASRSEYWWQMLTTWFLLVGAIFASAALAVVCGASEGAARACVACALLAVLLPLAIPNFAVTARRLHDRNMSGWWQLTAKIPYVGFIFGIYLLVTYVLPGVPEPNRFGSAPRRRR